jgi:hypothetical protein
MPILSKPAGANPRPPVTIETWVLGTTLAFPDPGGRP